jgi:putative membrane protein
MWWNDNSGWWVLMPLMMVVFWGAVIWLVMSFVRGSSGRPSGDRAEDPEGILAQRYARGEIDEDEYRRRLDILRGTQRPGGPR